jgi:hypothetical protein
VSGLAPIVSQIGPLDAFWRTRYATLTDPEGTGIDLYADLPAS